MKELANYWHVLIGDIGMAGVALSLLVVLWYEARLLTQRKLTLRYEYASAYEVNFLKTSAFIFSISITCFLFDFMARVLGMVQGYEFYFVAFISMAIGFLTGYSLIQYFNVYYPYILERKLSKIRFKPRLSPTTGKPMRLLNELEEDVYLTQEMIDQENAMSYDFDVWLDDETGFKLIERYNGHLHVLICPRCHFRTMKDYKEVIIESPGAKHSGVLRKHYKCSYCEHAETHDVKIASLAEGAGLGTTP
ncbi:MAG: hypothetical protein OEY56_09790 [Cyclobacteriaceae bacterium]|nr:hypothetical protein [Cyclobacteriaceae bacterium]